MDDIDNIVEEEVLEKDRSANTRRKNTWKKAISRYKLFVETLGKWQKHEDHEVGYFRNNNEVNALCGNSKKTNTKKASASYRHKGGYGKSMKYSRHDQRQIDNFEEEDA